MQHDILLRKLDILGFSSHLINFLRSYLTGRVSFVSYRGCCSGEILATSGVPQGSVLGPLLFNLFINDLSDIIAVPHLLYADDLKLFSTVSNLNDCVRLEESLQTIQEWASLSSLPLNIAKCEVMTYTLNHQFIEHPYKINNSLLHRPLTYSDLGVVFDVKLSFGAHLDHIVSRASKSLGYIIRNSKDFKNISTLKLLFFAFVRPHLEYASLVWSPYHSAHISRLEGVQRRFLKLLVFKLDQVYPPNGIAQNLLLSRFSVESLQCRRTHSALVFLFNLLHNRVNCPQILQQLYFLTPRLSSRSNDLFYLLPPRTNIRMNSPMYRICSLYNKVHSVADIHHSSRSLLGSIVPLPEN